MSLLGEIGIDLNSSASSGTYDPFDNETNILFSGATQSQYKPLSQTPPSISQTASGLGGTAGQYLGGYGSAYQGYPPLPVPAGITGMLQSSGAKWAIAAGGIVAVYLILKHKTL